MESMSQWMHDGKKTSAFDSCSGRQDFYGRRARTVVKEPSESMQLKFREMIMITSNIGVLLTFKYA